MQKSRQARTATQQVDAHRIWAPNFPNEISTAYLKFCAAGASFFGPLLHYPSEFWPLAQISTVRVFELPKAPSQRSSLISRVDPPEENGPVEGFI